MGVKCDQPYGSRVRQFPGPFMSFISKLMTVFFFDEKKLANYKEESLEQPRLRKAKSKAWRAEGGRLLCQLATGEMCPWAVFASAKKLAFLQMC